MVGCRACLWERNVRVVRAQRTHCVSTASDDAQEIKERSCLCRFCCKSLFALVIKISFDCTHDFRVKMWGALLREDKLAGDLGNVIEATSIRGRRSDFFTAGKLAPGHLGLLQQYLPTTDSCTAANRISIRSPRRRWGAQPAAPRCSALAPSASL
jgi:hypothetical protein